MIPPINTNAPGAPLLLAAFLMASILGLLLGSFYTAAATRVLYYFYGPGRKLAHRWREFFTRRSFCLECGTQIRPLDLVPLFGYIRLRGACRGCGRKIGPEHLAGEIFLGILLPLLLLCKIPWPSALACVLFIGHLYISLATDTRFFVLDHENTAFLYPLALIGAGLQNVSRNEFIQNHILTGLAVFAIFLLLYIAGRRRSLGLGDVLLAPAPAILIGFPWVLLLFQAAAGGAIIYVFLIRKDRRAPIPFGAFIAGATFLTVVVKSVWDCLVRSAF